ncbi:pirin family protein [Janthinobacterium agaricidamnosum]|uniref:Pirin family protein n=1 Tax=Janthinobacterium agaricidamnosum NBRC 102515 = DSM 9628 TaxID=1349767 RepID=W0V6S1_9BURK|nr:pirin family protein [Janthinobacterium agaricidamnosum]CDG82942.1 pirin family protein [Janthinobacterium agaricidamnosum NBRC 102515 = DSM 9628]
MSAVPNIPVRQVLYRSRGRRHGWFNRLMSPSDLGQHIKPFIFLDDFDMAGDAARGDGLHPHSGIATVTLVRSGQMDYLDTSGGRGSLAAGDVEWMQAGGGVWHGGSVKPGQRVRGFQLWLALPPEDENGPAHSRYLAPAEIPSAGPARVILGSYGAADSLIATRASLNYLHVTLKDGERWSYQPPAGHDVAWVALAQGALQVSGVTLQEEIAVFEESSAPLHFSASGDTDFVLGSAARHPHELVMGYYSVHSSAAALRQGEARIEHIRSDLNI